MKEGRAMMIAVVQGTRPEIVKNYSIVKALQALDVPHIVLHTNQHSEKTMCDSFYEQMDYAPHGRLEGEYRIGRAIDWLQGVYVRERVSRVLVNGDTAASIAGALAAMYVDIPVSHVEAGLRSRDPFMAEERNRIMVDAIADQLFAYTELEEQLLKSSEDVRGRVFMEGNTSVDVLADFAEMIPSRPMPDPYIFVTMHRKEFTDSMDRINMVLTVLDDYSKSSCRAVFSLHPRTANCIGRFGINLADFPHIDFMPPLPILQALAYQKHAQTIVTDSGCIQEEAYLFGVPCITVRNNTERHLTIMHGANVLTGFDTAIIREALHNASRARSGAWPQIYGAPGVGERIVSRIACATQ
jgi:UDP-N-acetylglucosamine 2-epimerase